MSFLSQIFDSVAQLFNQIVMTRSHADEYEENSCLG